MSIIGRPLLLAILFCSAVSCISPDGNKLRTEAQSQSNRQVLVTFKDERRNRPPVSDPVNAYRQRGGYENSTWSLRVAEQLAEDYGLAPVEQWPIDTLGIHCVVYQVPGEQPLDSVIKRLEQDRRVESAQAMQHFHVMGGGYSDPYFKLQRGMREMNIEAAHQIATGRNIKIAVIDTGVDATHPDLNGQIALEQNFVPQSRDSHEDIHGTAVAGVIAASANNRQGIVGMAPGARLIALKACWPVVPLKPEADCDSLTLSLALNSAINLKPQVINLSLTGDRDPLVERLVNKAMEEGIIVVASTRPPSAGERNFPASIPGVIGVYAATTVRESNAPVAGGIAAPGQEILTTLPNGTYNFMSGSSFAAAHVSGLIALLLELKPHLVSAQIVTMLQASMTAPTAVHALNTINVCKALANATGLPACGSPATKAVPVSNSAL